MTDPHQPLTALAQMLGEIAAMHREQSVLNGQHMEALHAQSERQSQLLQTLVGQAGAPSASSPPLAFRGVTLHRMTEADDPQSFLEMFEGTAEACGWPTAEWAVRLLPLLSGDAQSAAAVVEG